MKTFFALTLALTAVSSSVAADDHDHDHTNGFDKGHKCACDAILYGFAIDCTNIQAVTDAVARLQANGCSSNCHTEACEKDYLILQSHHDHCPIDALPVSVENSFHDYDRICDSCNILRQEDPGAPACPTVNCDDGSGNAAYQRLLTRNCNLQFQCTEANCKDDWLTLRMVHDSCPHTALSQGAEEGLHALEEPCAAFKCNLPKEMIKNSLECFADELEETKKHHGMHTSSDDEKQNESSPTKAPTGGGFDMGSGGVANKLATGSIAIMAIAVAALF